MYHHTIAHQIYEEKQRDMMAAADRERRARQARSAPAPEPPRRPYRRRTWQLARSLRTQAQS